MQFTLIFHYYLNEIFPLAEALTSYCLVVGVNEIQKLGYICTTSAKIFVLLAKVKVKG